MGPATRSLRSCFLVVLTAFATTCFGVIDHHIVVAKVKSPFVLFGTLRSGTAWCLDTDCELMVTNYHVLEAIGKHATVNGENVDSAWSATGPTDEGARSFPSFTKVYKYTLVRDLALLRMRSPMSRRGMRGVRLFMGQLQPGEPVTVLSYPGGKFAITKGSFEETVEEGVLEFKLTTPLAAGSSGGLILNQHDEAVGVLFALHPSLTSAYAVPIWSLADFVKRVQPAAFSSLFPTEVYKPLKSDYAFGEAIQAERGQGHSEADAEKNPGPFLASAIGALDPIAALPSSFLRSVAPV